MPTIKTGSTERSPRSRRAAIRSAVKTDRIPIHPAKGSPLIILRLASLCGIAFQQMGKPAIPLADIIIRLGQGEMQPALVTRRERSST